MKKKKTSKKEVKEIKEEVKVKITDIGEVLELTADKNNPISGDVKEGGC